MAPPVKPLDAFTECIQGSLHRCAGYKNVDAEQNENEATPEAPANEPATGDKLKEDNTELVRIGPACTPQPVHALTRAPHRCAGVRVRS